MDTYVFASHLHLCEISLTHSLSVSLSLTLSHSLSHSHSLSLSQEEEEEEETLSLLPCVSPFPSFSVCLLLSTPTPPPVPIRDVLIYAQFIYSLSLSSPQPSGRRRGHAYPTSVRSKINNPQTLHPTPFAFLPLMASYTDRVCVPRPCGRIHGRAQV